jgi:NADPH:quinone reductase-like Zn-dependent oxidoreductase
MKAWIIEKLGIESLRLVDRPRPTPRRGELLVRIRAASLNYRDLMVIGGKYLVDQPLPLVPVSDGAGEVVEVGEGVTRFRAGDRVIGAYAQAWVAGPARRESAHAMLGAPLDGVLAEYAVFAEIGAVHAPAHLSFEEASTLPIAAVTAWDALFGHQALHAGETVVVQGTGGVAVFAIQLARAAGATVVVTSSSEAKLARARELGAHHGIDYRRHPAWDERVLELTAGEGADLLVDVAGGDLRRSVRAVRHAGQVSLVGALTGPAAELDIIPLLVKQVRLQGIHVGSRVAFEALNRALEAHRIHPVVDRTFAFDEAPEAFRALAKAEHFGKLVVRGA